MVGRERFGSSLLAPVELIPFDREAALRANLD
jgi:hypothetical protein